MPALTGNRAPERLETRSNLIGGKMGAVAKIHMGTLCCYSGGYVVPASATTGLTFAGLALDSFENPGAVAGGADIELEWCNPGADINTAAGETLDQTHVGSLIYFLDDHTVTRTSATNTRSVAGRLLCIKDGLAYFRPAP